MKKVYFMLLVLLSLITVNVNAQIYSDVYLGVPVGIGTPLEDAHGSLGYTVDVMYRTSMVGNNLSFGVDYVGNIFGSSEAEVDNKLYTNNDVSYHQFWGAKARLDIGHNVVVPYLGIAMGWAKAKAYPEWNAYHNTKDDGCTFISYQNSALAVKPEIGVTYKWFSFGASYILPHKYFDHHGTMYKASSLQVCVGARFNISRTSDKTN